MFCVSCGFELPKNSVACSACGENFNGLSNKIIINTNKPRNEVSFLGLFGAFVFICLVAAAGFFGYKEYKEYQKNQNSGVDLNIRIK